jgi:hypothetical protein
VFCLTVLSVASCTLHMLELSVLVTFQERIDSLTVEGVENVGGEDWIEIKTEEELVGRVKCEQEVSVLCCVLCTGVCVCVCVVLCIVFSYALFTYCTSHYSVSA